MLKRHYEKVVVGCCFLFIFANIGLASTAFSVHQPYLVALDGVGDTGGSLILSVRTLTSLLAMLVVDRYYRLLDVRRGVFIAGVMTFGGFAMYSWASATGGALATFFGGAVLLGLGYGLGGMVAMTYLANRWFASGVGSVVGFASMGSGLASIVVPIVVVHVIEASSLSTAFLIEGCTALAINLLVFVLLRNRPADLGMEAYRGKGDAGAGPGGGGADYDAGGSPTDGSSSSAGAPVARNDSERAAAVPVGERMLLMAAMVGVGVFSCCGITYISVLATSSGFDTLFAATLVSVAGISLTISKFAAGELFDHLGAPRGSAIMFAFAGVGFALCCFAGMGSHAIMLAGAITIGAGLSLGTVGISVWSLDLSDPATRTRQIKNFQVAYALGGFIANTLPGIVKDLVGTYVVSYAAMIVVTAFCAVVVLRFYRKFKQ